MVQPVSRMPAIEVVNSKSRLFISSSSSLSLPDRNRDEIVITHESSSPGANVGKAGNKSCPLFKKADLTGSTGCGRVLLQTHHEWIEARSSGLDLEFEVGEPGFEALDEFGDLLCLQMAVVEMRAALVLVSEPVEQSDQAAGRVVLAELQLPVGEANELALADLDILHRYRAAP